MRRFIARGSPVLHMLGLVFVLLSLSVGALGASTPEPEGNAVVNERTAIVSPEIAVDSALESAFVMDTAVRAGDAVQIAVDEPAAAVTAAHAEHAIASRHAMLGLDAHRMRDPASIGFASDVERPTGMHAASMVRMSDRLRC